MPRASLGVEMAVWKVSWNGDQLSTLSCGSGNPPEYVSYKVGYRPVRNGRLTLEGPPSGSARYSWVEETASGGCELRKTGDEEWEGSGWGTYGGRWRLWR